MNPTGVERRHHLAARAGFFLLAPLCDSYHGLSLNRFLAIYFAQLAGHGRLIHDQPLTMQDVSIAVLAASLAFGPKIFAMFLNRGTGEKP